MNKWIDKLQGARRSLVIWFNALLLAALPMYQIVVDELPKFQQYMPEHMYKYVGMGVVIINILLRFRTTTALENK